MKDHLDGTVDLVEEEVDTYSRFLAGDTESFREYMREETLAEMEEYEDPVSLEDAVQEAGQNAIKHYREERPDEAAETFKDVSSEAVWSDEIPSVYKEEVLRGVAMAATAYLQEEGTDVDEPRDVELRFDRATGSYDWHNDVVRVGEQEPRIEYKPAMFGMMVHEMFHKKQFEDLMAESVEAYNEALEETGLDLEQVEEDHPEHHSYGTMMAAEGEVVEQLLERAAEQDHPEAEQYLRRALDEELETYAHEPADPFDVEREVRSVDLFGPEEEIVPHIKYLEAEGIDDRQGQEAYLTGVVRKNTGGEMIEAEMRERLGL
jgi:hypothetical protein